MQLVPAIDVRDGHCVRLFKGRFDAETIYDIDVATLAARYASLGATWLHVVDLDGAAHGSPVHLDLIGVLRRTGCRLQIGGGLRSHDSVLQAVDVADRIVIGSQAISEPVRVAGWLREFGPERVTLAFDVRIDAHGIAFVTTHGWTRTSVLTLDDAIARYVDAGLQHVLCTDVDRDGAMTGPNLALYRYCCRRWPGIQFQASGGIRTTLDLDALAETGVASAISGRALLDDCIPAPALRRYLKMGATLTC